MLWREGDIKLNNLLLYGFIVAIIISMIASYTDMKKRIIPDTLSVINIVLAILIYRTHILNNLINAVILFLAMLFIALITSSFGGGDIKILSTMTLLIGRNIYFTILLAGIGMMILALIRASKTKENFFKIKYPFAPFILGGVLIMFIINILMKGVI